MSLDQFAAVRHHFNDLANHDEDARLAASGAILSGLEGAPTADIEKALERLVKGLASGRKAARIGFSITLTELLARIFGPESQQPADGGFNLTTILERLKQYTVPRGKVTGQEERDNLFGRLFGLEAILAAGLLGTESVSKVETEQVLDLVFGLAKEKPWLREECGWILFKALQSGKAPNGDVHEKSGLHVMVIEKLCENKLALTPEGVAIWLSVYSRLPNLKVVKSPWRQDDPLHVDNRIDLAKVLKESPIRNDTAEGDDEGNQRGMWSTKPHFVWDVIFGIFYEFSSPQESAGGTKRLSFEVFWQHAIDDSLFSASASKERKYWGFMLFTKAFEEAPKPFLPAIFGENMLRCFTNQLSEGIRYLHRTALRALKLLHAKVEADPRMAYFAIAGFTRNGSYDFDHATKTKTISRLFAEADEVVMEQIVRTFNAAVRNVGDLENKAVESRRQTIASQFVTALRSKAIGEGPNVWVGSLLYTLATFAYLSTAKPRGQAFAPALSETSRNMFRARLSTCFAQLLSSTDPKKHDWPCRVLLFLEEHDTTLDKPALSEQIFEEVQSAVKRLRHLDKLESSKKEKRKPYVQAFKLLYALVIFQIYDGDTDGPTVLSEVDDCYEKLFGEAEGSADASSEILVEILLSLASKRSVLLRKVSQQVFTAFAKDIKSGGLQLLFNVLETKESLEGQQALFDQEAEDDEEDDDVEMVDVDGDLDKSDASETGSDVDNSNTDDSDVSDGGSVDEPEEVEAEGNEEELTRLNQALAQIVGTKPFTENGAGKGEDSSSDDAMDDDEMFALDDQMVNVFKERRKVTNKKQEKKDAKETIINFKNRVLDLLDIYIKQQHQNKLVLNVIMPLLVLSRTSGSKQVADRSCALIRDLAQRCKGKELPQPKKARHAFGLLSEIHEEAMKEGSRAHATACSQSSLVLVKVLVRLDEEHVEPVVDRYAKTQVLWLKGKQRVQPLLFSDFLNWSTSYSKQHQ